MIGVSGESIFEVDSNIDVVEDDGFIILAEDKEIPDNWQGVEDINSYRSLDRNFVIAGSYLFFLPSLITQVRLLVCLSTNKQNSVSRANDAKTDEQSNQNGEARDNNHPQKDASTAQILQRFKNSYFFARIAESNEPLWSERSAQEACFKLMETSKEKSTGDSSETAQILKNKNPTSVVIDRGELHSPTSGGVVRGDAKFFPLSNGDIVVILQVKVGVEFMRDPILEILQLQKYHDRNHFFGAQQLQASSNKDPYGELLNWLLPVNNSRRLSTSPSSPWSSSSFRPSLQSTTPKRAVSLSSGLELFSFGHVRSYSMSAIQSNKGQPKTVTKTDARPSPVQEDQYQFSFRSFIDIGNSGNEKLLSFRGVPLVPERFSIQCGLEGLCTPGRSWRRKFDLIQPLEIHSFSVDCNTDDLLCVCIKNVSPVYAPDVVVFIDSITMVFEEASSRGPPLSVPVTCSESGNGYSLPNLALRRDEEHSFILKPVTTLWRNPKGEMDSKVGRKSTSARTARSSHQWHPSFNEEFRYSDPPNVQYAVLVSCRCNYTESKLFFRHPVSWRPRVGKDLIISVASDTSRPTLSSNGTQLPVQALTLQASNMTPDDLTLTVMNPSSFSSLSRFKDFPSLASSNEECPQSDSISNRSNVIPSTDLSCTHLCLQTRVPLGCVPSQSTVAINLELLSVTNSIVTLDSLEIDVEEKGCVYKPKHALKIAATSSIEPFLNGVDLDSISESV